MTDNTRTVLNCLRKFWKLAKERKYHFWHENDKDWLNTSIDSMLKYSKLTRDVVLESLESLKSSDFIDYLVETYNGRDMLRFSNNW